MVFEEVTRCATSPGSWHSAPWKIDSYPKQADLKDNTFSKPSFLIIFLVSMSHFRGCILSFFGRGSWCSSTSGWCKFEGFSGQQTTIGEAQSVLKPLESSPKIWGVSQLSTKWATTKNSLINRVKELHWFRGGTAPVSHWFLGNL